MATAKGVFSGVEVAAKDRVRAAELLGKSLVMWTDKQDINANINPVQIVDNNPKDSDDDG